MMTWIGVGTALQTAMVVVGHWTPAVANLFGPLGMTISLVVGLMWARSGPESYGQAALGGAIVGGTCALVGIAISYLMGDVTAIILAFGTASSAVAGALGGLAGRRLRPAAGRVS